MHRDIDTKNMRAMEARRLIILSKGHNIFVMLGHIALEFMRGLA